MDKRTYRKCVRIIICDDDEIVLGKKYIHGKFSCYEFPGGGIEDGDDFQQTVIKEALEEVGIRVDDVQSLGLEFKYEIDYPNPERAKLYRGGVDIWYMAKFVSYDKSLLNSEGDALPYTWETIPNAVRKIKEGPKSTYNDARVAALNKVIDIQEKAKDKHLSHHW